MEAVKNKWLWGIFISILSIFAMSHNVSAFSRISLNGFLDYERSQYAYSTTESGSLGYAGTSDFTNNIFNLGNYDYTYLGFAPYTVPAGFDEDDYSNYTFRATVVSSSIPVFSSSPVSPIISSSIQEIDCSSIKMLLSGIEFGNATAYQNGLPQNYMRWEFNSVYYYATSCYNVEIYGITGGYNSQYPKGKVHFGQKGSKFQRVLTYYDSNLNIRYGTLIISPEITYYLNDSEATSEKEKEETQNAVDDSQAAGGSSSQDAQTGTTGLLNAITGAVSVISSASPTNCKINGNMGNLDMGQLDLCANPAPAFIQTIGSLILILMCVPLAISLFNRFIAIFRSFQS